VFPQVRGASAASGRTEVPKAASLSARPLTDWGRRQVDALGEMLGGAHFGAVLSSPLSRAWETMERGPAIPPTGKRAKTPLEWDYEVYEGRRTADIRLEVPGWSVWTHEIIGGEPVEQVGERADRTIARALAADGPVVVFAHGYILRIVAVSTLGWERENRVIRHWNQTCHLRSMDPVL
jgi:broad specificity phosphatase PhoE